MVQTLGRSNNLNSLNLFDDTAGYDDEIGVQFASGLSEEEKRQAVSLYRLFNELWGVALVKGDPGSGKDLLGNYITYKFKRFFPQKRILRDEKPRALFGSYAGLFNEQVIQSDLAKMRAIAKGTKATEVDSIMEKAADEWVKNVGEVMLKNSVLYLTEYWRYCYNREPHNPMNKTMGAIQKVKRHLDTLVIGTTQLLEELDKKTCKPWVDWVITCVHSQVRKGGFSYFVQKVKYDRRTDMFIHIGRPFPISFDAGQPRSTMGNGKITIRRFNYNPVTEEERIVLDVLKAGMTNYEELVELLETEGDMLEEETLSTLKELSFNPRKKVIDYPCYFRLYNSKSAPQLRSSLKVTE